MEKDKWYVVLCCMRIFVCNETAATGFYTHVHTLSLHDALPICPAGVRTPTAPLVRMSTQRTLLEGWLLSIQIRTESSSGSPLASRARPSERNTTVAGPATSTFPSTRELRSRVSPALKALLRSSSTKVIQPSLAAFEIGSASGRVRVCQYV